MSVSWSDMFLCICDIKHPLHLVTTPMLAAPLWCNFPCLERGNDTNGGVWGPWPLRFEESHLAHPRLLCAQRWWPIWGLGLAGKHTEGIASFRSPTLWRDIVVLRSKSACKILRLILVIMDQEHFFFVMDLYSTLGISCQWSNLWYRPCKFRCEFIQS